MDALLTGDFSSALSTIKKVKTARGIALADLVGAIFDSFMDIQVSKACRIYILEGLAAIESHLASGCSEPIQLSAFVGVFKVGLELN